MPIGDSIVLDRVYRSCLDTIGGYETRVDLQLLNMVDFNMILGMDWLSPYHVILDCHAKTVALAIQGLSRLEWRRSLGHVPSRVVYFLNAQQIVEKGCLAYLAFVRDVSADTHTVKSVLIVRYFPDVFPVDLSGMPPDMDIDFGFDLVLGTQHISIPLYRMDPVELKE
ncbi:uncharacterized protein [Nicotiana tomentosiformis]|uniref:uncharacterized protein n=1 Tax=Nicotiana tomentosiformis TaxID=4098 RepID=UPI00388CD20F